MAGQLSELDRLQLQARVWEPAGERLLQQFGDGTGLRVVDVGCGCFGWLRLLSRWVGPTGEVVGTDIDDTMLKAAEELAASEGLTNVRVIRDDLFESQLPRSAFDLVHSRFQIAPLGRAAEQLACYRDLATRDGHIVIEDPDSASWRFNPTAQRLKASLRSSAPLSVRRGGTSMRAGTNPSNCNSRVLIPACERRYLPSHLVTRTCRYPSSSPPRLNLDSSNRSRPKT